MDEVFAEFQAVQPIAIPVVAEGSAGDTSGAVDYVYWARPKAAGKNILGVLVEGNCLEPDVKSGDMLFADANLSPKNGNLVICLTDGKLQIKRYRQVKGEVWLENRLGKVKNRKIILSRAW